MPAKPSREIKKLLSMYPKRTGDIYVTERQSVYDPAKKYHRIISNKLIAKIPICRYHQETFSPTPS